MTQNQWHPGTLLELSGYFWKTGTLHAAVKLDIFSIVGSETLSGKEIAAATGANPDGMQRLLDALAAMDLLIKDNAGMYANTHAAEKYLSKSSPDYIGYMILHHHYLVDLWKKLDKSVVTGKSVREGSPFDNEDEREAFLMGMFNSASLSAPGIVRHVDLGGRRRLLDMGGGPGTYAIYFCRQNPDLTATVFDLPTTRPFAEKVISDFKMSGHIGFEEGSYLDMELPGMYDVIWMSHILHAEGWEECRQMIEKAYRALEPGGMVVIHEFILDDSRTKPLFPALFSLNMLVGTDDGRAYTETELTEMLQAAGFTNVRRLSYTGPSASGLLTAEK